jgi:PEP-CTERM motif-containing protein
MKRSAILRAWCSVSLLLSVLVLRPAPLEATPVLVTFGFPFSYGGLEFGSDLGFARIVDDAFVSPDDLLSGPNGDFSIVGGTFNLVSGALLDVVPSGGDAVYTYDAGGSVSIEFDLLLSDGSIHHGSFQAPLGFYTIFPDGPGGGGDTDGPLGAGLFDKGTAKLLGINPHTLSGDASLFLDTVDSSEQTQRVAQAFGYVNVVAVPEPSLLWLIALGGAALSRARRRTGNRMG